MDLRRVRAFRMIVEAGGLTKAAGLLHITPGALSKSMRQLENEVGGRLFAKAGRALRLTDRGQRLYNASAALIEAHTATLRALDEPREAPSRTLRLVTNEVFATHALGALLDGALADHPAHVLELHGSDLERAIVDHEADIGITYLPAPRIGLAYRPLGDMGFGIFVRAGAFADVDFADLPFAIPTTRIDSAISDVLGIDCWPYERAARRVQYRLRSLESALELARRGLSAVFAPKFLIALHNDGRVDAHRLVERRAPAALGRIERHVVLVHREQDAHDPLVAQVSDAIAGMLRGAVDHA